MIAPAEALKPSAELPYQFPLDEAMEEAFSPLVDEVDVQKAAEALQAGLVNGDTSLSEDARPCTREAISVIAPLRDQPPETVAQRLASLQPWKARFVLQLMECGGVMGLAATKTNVSLKSVEEHLKVDTDFAKACAEAVAHSTDLVEAAVMRGATIGDLGPVYQGGRLVGYKRTRNTKDAELALTIRGRMPDQKLQVNHTGRVEIQQDDGLPAQLAAISAMLFADQARVIEGKVVSESDKSEG